MTVRSGTAAFAIALTTTNGCRGQDNRSDEARPVDREYRAAVANWKRDSAVVDSLAKLVNIDSLVNLTRHVIRARTFNPYAQAIACQFFRLSWRHGSRPSLLAIGRAKERHFTQDERAVYDRLSVAGNGRMTELSEQACGPLGPPAPDSVAGVDLNAALPKPSHPDSV